MQSQILLVVGDEIRRSQFENFFKKERVICQAVTSLRDVSTQIARQPYNAIFHAKNSQIFKLVFTFSRY